MSTAEAVQGKPSQTIFFSGHSLLDNPLPDDVVAIARSLGHAKTEYNQQNTPGSPLRIRTRGTDPQSKLWLGYQSGKSRDGPPLNVLNEIAQPRTVASAYTTLVITERHDFVSALMWEDTVRYLRHFHDRFQADPRPTATFFYQPWLGLRKPHQVADWIAYERAAEPAWRCVSTRINQSLSLEGKADRITPLAANLALAELVEMTLQAPTQGTPSAVSSLTFDSLVSDGVHLTRTGVYYMALVTYALTHAQSPEGAWHPAQVPKALAKELQKIAASFAMKHREIPALTLPQCSALMVDNFCERYSNYIGDKHAKNCQKFFALSNPDNPFRVVEESDKSYWFAAP